jgi:hypothetical protein
MSGSAARPLRRTVKSLFMLMDGCRWLPGWPGYSQGLTDWRVSVSHCNAVRSQGAIGYVTAAE